METNYFLPADGDVVLGAEPSFLQGLGEGVGDPYRHAAVVASIRGRTTCVQVKDHVIGKEPLESFIDRYSEVLVLRCADEGVARQAADWAVRQLGEHRRYPLDDCLLAGLVGSARAASLPRAHLRAVVGAAVQRASERPAGAGLSCSSFIAEAYTSCGLDLVRSLLSPLAPVLSVTAAAAADSPPLDPLRPTPSQVMRILGDVRVIDRALRVPVVRPIGSVVHNRLVTPGDLSRSDVLVEVARFRSGIHLLTQAA